MYQPKYLDYVKESNQFVYKLLLSLKAYYTIDIPGRQCLDCTTDLLSCQLFSDYPGILYSDDKPVYEELFKKLASLPEIEDAPTTVLERFRETFLASSILGIAHDVTELRRPFSALLEACSGLEAPKIEESNEEAFAELDLGLALAERNSMGLLEWRLKYLRKSLGPLRKGDFGFIFARPESGKTTFLISEISHFLTQTKDNILWIANEEESTGIITRLYSSVLSTPISVVLGEPQRFVAPFLEQGGKQIHLCNSSSVGKRRIKEYCEEFQPALIVIDQLDKVHGFDAERHDLKMKAIYQWARELAKEYCPVIGVCQAGGSAEGKMWLDMNDVDSSHTAKQGEADWIMGIGKSANEDLANIRYLHILKNKLLGGGESDPALKHSKTQVKINLDLFRYEDIIYK